MPKGINYGRLMEKALRRMIADVLARVAREGLPGKHHFLITFDTTHPGVDMSASLRERYPGDMTIVMQEWFENLAVMGDRFTVTLNFGNVQEPIVIPFEAIVTFADPSVEFGLVFRPQEAEDGSSQAEDEEEPAPLPPPSRPTPIKPQPGAGGDVVSIDKFRKH